MFLYRFLQRHRRVTQTDVHAIAYEQPFRFFSLLAWLMALTYMCILPGSILFDFEFQVLRSNKGFAISSVLDPGFGRILK